MKKKYKHPSYYQISSAMDGNENAIENILAFYDPYISKSSGESVLLSCLNTVAEQERGGTLNHAPLKSAILFLLVQYQKYQNLKSF